MAQQRMADAPRVLLVDDDQDLLEELAEGLAIEEFPALIASSAEEAMMLLTRNPSLAYVVTDLMMPGIGGLEFIGKIASLRSRRQIVSIVVTGAATLEHAVSALRHGVTDFLQKPVAAAEIAHVVRRYQKLHAAEASTIGDIGTSMRREILETLIKSLKERSRVFGDGLVGDPVWEMLLDLAIAQERGEAVSTTSLCIGARIATTTGLRRIDELERMGMIKRKADTSDRRRMMVTLTPLGDERMQAFLDQFGKRFLPLREMPRS